MASYKLSELAEEDFRLIAVKSIQDWGHTQAEKYIILLHETMIKIANTPDIGKSRPELFEEAQSFPVQKHIIYYWKTPTGIDIARVLHQRMDVLTAFD